MRISKVNRSRLRSSLIEFGFTFLTDKIEGCTKVFNEDKQIITLTDTKFILKTENDLLLQIVYKQVDFFRLKYDWSKTNLIGTIVFRNLDTIDFYISIEGKDKKKKIN